jgi:preprotein translocase subunit SecF
MVQFFHNANFRFMWGRKWIFLAISGVALLTAAGVIAVRGFNYGIDFAGGTAVQVRFRERPRVEALRGVLERAGLGDITIQGIGDPDDNEVLIRAERTAEPGASESEGGDVSQKVLEALRSLEDTAEGASGRIDLNTVSEPALREFLAGRLTPAPDAASPGGAPPDPARLAAAIIEARNEHNGLFTGLDQVRSIPGVDGPVAALLEEGATIGSFSLRGIDFVGPTAGRELMQNTGWAILGSVVGILVYVWFRFHRIAWGVASVFAVVHDVTIAAGAMALTGKEISLPIVAALLTILGYSINDTIVTFDRIRENLRLYRDVDFERVVNASVNQTLSRTVLTSFTVFVAVFALFLYGGDKLNPMSFCLLVGLVSGTYSTIYIAAALLVVTYRFLGPQYARA